jgi:hypothetical protein
MIVIVFAGALGRFPIGRQASNEPRYLPARRALGPGRIFARGVRQGVAGLQPARRTDYYGPWTTPKRSRILPGRLGSLARGPEQPHDATGRHRWLAPRRGRSSAPVFDAGGRWHE